MRDKDLTLVRQLPLFRDMADECFEDMMRAAFLQHFPPRVQLITQGDPADFLYVVIDGAIEMFAANGGRESTISIERPVSTFILAAAMVDAVYLMSARTLEKSRLLMIPAESVRTAFNRDAAFARSMVVELARCYRAMVKQVKNQKLRTGAERLANYLLRLHAMQGPDPVVVLPIEKRTLASLLGMTSENLSRAFAALGEHGVSVRGNRIEIGDPAALVHLGTPSTLIDDPET